MKLILIFWFHMSKISSIQHIINVFFLSRIWNPTCILYPSTFQCGLGMFQALKSHIWLLRVVCVNLDVQGLRCALQFTIFLAMGNSILASFKSWRQQLAATSLTACGNCFRVSTKESNHFCTSDIIFLILAIWEIISIYLLGQLPMGTSLVA